MFKKVVGAGDRDRDVEFSGVSFDILKVPVIDHQGDVKALERFI